MYQLSLLTLAAMAALLPFLIIVLLAHRFNVLKRLGPDRGFLVSVGLYAALTFAGFGTVNWLGVF